VVPEIGAIRSFWAKEPGGRDLRWPRQRVRHDLLPTLSLIVRRMSDHASDVGHRQAVASAAINFQSRNAASLCRKAPLLVVLCPMYVANAAVE
jgi:hypothetical protein